MPSARLLHLIRNKPDVSMRPRSSRCGIGARSFPSEDSAARLCAASRGHHPTPFWTSVPARQRRPAACRRGAHLPPRQPPDQP